MGEEAKSLPFEFPALPDITN